MARRTLVFALVAGLVVLSGAAAGGGKTTRASVGPGGLESNGYSDWPAISADGDIVAFYSFATNLVPGDTNGATDVFVHDRRTSSTRRVSVSSTGEEGNGPSWFQQLDAAGDLVAFSSEASNLVEGDENGAPDVFVHDLRSGETELVSVATSGERGNWWSYQLDLGPDGRLLAWASNASNLAPGDTNGLADVFVRDLAAGVTRRVSVSSTGVQGDGHSERPALSVDGRFVAFESWAANLVPGDTNGVRDVFVHDLVNGTTERVSVSSAGGQGGRDSHWPAISADGRFVAFEGDAEALVATDGNGDASNILVHDRTSRTTELVSLGGGGVQANSESRAPVISADGRFVAFDSWASNLAVEADTNGSLDVFVRSRPAGRTARVSVDDRGRQANGNSHAAAITPDGRFVAYSSIASNLAASDANGTYDVYVYGPVAFADTPPRKPCRIPRVVGLRLAAAKTLIRHRQCAVGAVRRVETAARKVGRVVRQRPRPGTVLAHRARVDLVVGARPAG